MVKVVKHYGWFKFTRWCVRNDILIWSVYIYNILFWSIASALLRIPPFIPVVVVLSIPIYYIIKVFGIYEDEWLRIHHGREVPMDEKPHTLENYPFKIWESLNFKDAINDLKERVELERKLRLIEKFNLSFTDPNSNKFKEALKVIESGFKEFHKRDPQFVDIPKWKLNIKKVFYGND